MTAAALALVATAAVLHTAWNLLAKQAHDPFAFLWWTLVLASIALAPLTVLEIWRWQDLASTWPLAVLTGAVHGLYFFALSQAYRHGDYSRVYPIARGLGVGMVPLAAWPLLGEQPSPLGAIGILTVLTGVIVVGRPRSLPGRGDRSTAWAILTGLTVTAYSLIDRTAVQSMSPMAYAAFLWPGATLCLLPMALRRTTALRREWRQSRGRLLFATAATLGGYVLVLYAFRHAATGYVVAAREISIVLSTVAGTLVLGERHGRARLVGAAIVLAGVSCIAATGP